MKALILIFLISCTNSFAFTTNQCLELSLEQAKQTLKILKDFQVQNEVPVIDKFCEICFDDFPKAIVLDKIDYIKKNNKYQIAINNKITDMAYVYVSGKNLASQIKCKTAGVSKLIN